MTNLTVTVDEEVLRKARIRALQEGRKLNAVVQELLASYAREEQERRGRRRAIEHFLKLAARSRAGSEEGRTWTRDELHERG